MERKQLFIKIDEAALMWNKTKDPYYKTLWYNLLKQFSNIEKDEPYAPNATR